MATIHSIVYQPIDQEYDQRLDNFIRVPIQEAKLIAGHGIEGDAKAGHHPNRQLSVLSTGWLEVMGAQGYKTNPGEFGEQMVIRDLAVEQLNPNARLQLGDSAVIEIVKARTGCERLQLVQGPIDENMLVSIGMMAKVVTGGMVRVGDEVKVMT